MPKPSRFQANPDTKTKELSPRGFRRSEGAERLPPVRRPRLAVNSGVRRQLLNWDRARQEVAADVAASVVSDGEVASEQALSEGSNSYQSSFESQVEAGEEDEDAELTESEDGMSYQQLSQVKAAILRSSNFEEIDEIKDALGTSADWTSSPWWIRQGPTMTQYRWDMAHQPSADWRDLAGLNPMRRDDAVLQTPRQHAVEDRELDEPKMQSIGLPLLPAVPPPPPLQRALPEVKFGLDSAAEDSGSEVSEASSQGRLSVPIARLRDARRLRRQHHAQGTASLPSLARNERSETADIARRTAARQTMRTSRSVFLAIDARKHKETADMMSRTGAFGQIMEANLAAMAQVSWSLPQVRRSGGTALRRR